MACRVLLMYGTYKMTTRFTVESLMLLGMSALGALVFSSGLAMRVPPQSVPVEITSSSGTLPGFILGGLIFAVALAVHSSAPRTTSFLMVFTIGGLSFATGATTLSFVNNAR